MRIKISQEKLADLLDSIFRIIEKRQTIPVLGNVLLHADNGHLTARGTDLIIEIIAHTGAIVERPGGSTVNIHVLNEIVRKHKADTNFTLDDNGAVMTVKAGRSTFRLPTLPADHFPAPLKMGESLHSFELAASVLRGMIEPIEVAISTETTRLYLTGIYFHIDAGRLRAVATDGYRLGLTQIEAPEGSLGMPGIIVGKKAIGELSRMLVDYPDDQLVMLHVSDQRIQIEAQNSTLTTSLVEGVYPDYQRTIPRTNGRKLVAVKADLAEAVDRVSTVGTVKRGMKFAIRPGHVELSVQGLEKGTAMEEISVDYEGEPLEVGYNSKYFLDAIHSLGESIEIWLSDSQTPTLVRTAGTEDPFHVLVPMRV